MKKELFYIRGNAERADEVKAALLEKYPDIGIDSDYTRFTQPECLYYNHNGFADYVKPSEIALMDVLTKYGTELHLHIPEVSKFNVGDVIYDKSVNSFKMVSLLKNDNIHIALQLANSSCNKGNLRLATKDEIKEWNEKTLHPMHRHYSAHCLDMVYWFHPFDKVLVRDENSCFWRCNLFSHYIYDSAQYRCVNAWFKQCIPYNEKTAHLLGTTDAYEEEEL